MLSRHSCRAPSRPPHRHRASDPARAEAPARPRLRRSACVVEKALAETLFPKLNARGDRSDDRESGEWEKSQAFGAGVGAGRRPWLRIRAREQTRVIRRWASASFTSPNHPGWRPSPKRTRLHSSSDQRSQGRRPAPTPAVRRNLLIPLLTTDHEIDLALAAIDADAHRTTVAADGEIHRRLAHAEAPNHDFVQAIGQHGVRQDYLAFHGVDRNAQHALEHEEGRRRRARLG